MGGYTMSRYRKIEVRTWSDEKFRALSPVQPSGQGLWFFLLTGPHTGPIPGLFRAGRAAMAEELGWPLEAFDKAFREVSEQGMAKADFVARLMWLPNAIKHNKPESPNVVKSWAAEFDLLPECPLKLEALEAIKTFVCALGTGFSGAFAGAFESHGKPSDKASGKPSGKPSGKTMPNQEQEQEQEVKVEGDMPPVSSKAADPCPYQQIIDLYHEAMPNNPRCKVPNPARRAAIKARWVEAAKLTCKPFGYDNREDGLKAWRTFFEICADSDFLTGRAPATNGRPPFVASIDFLMRQQRFAEILENKYHREAAA
ncbi:MAG TPA: hypothetical protein PLM62_07755 [Zoogloea sp.]|nr:hypothetical protein [Zoogloea sp.]